MNNEKMNGYMKARWKARRLAAVAVLGGACNKCGSGHALEFDHVDRETKSFDIAQLSSASEDRFWKEIKKCQLLCRSCHKAKTSKEIGVDHGGGLTGKRNCRCDLCKPLKNVYARKNHGTVAQ